MTEIKSYQFDDFLKRGCSGYRVFLIYGPDRGLVSERAQAIAAKSGIDLTDPFAVTKMDSSEIEGSGRIIDEVSAIGLFGGDKLIWLRSSGNDKSIADALKVIADKPPESAVLIIEAGDLRKGVALRKTAESSRDIASIPCYADDTRALNSLIDESLGKAQLRITPQARQLLLSLIGGDRLATRNEIDKLLLYARGMELIDEDDVIAVIGDASATSADDAVDAVLAGDINGLKQAMSKIAQSKTPIFLILNGCLRQFQLLDLMRAQMEAEGQNVSQVMQTSGRNIFFRRKPLFEKALRSWNSAATRRALQSLQQAVLSSRRNGALEESIAMQTLLSLTVRSARGS